MILRSTQALRGRRLIIVAGLAASTLLVGCDTETATSRAVDNARMQLLAMSSGETLTPASQRATVYQSVLAELRPVADRGTSSQNAAAALLVAQAQAGLAEAPMGIAMGLEAEAMHRKQAVRSMLSQWQTFSALAAAAASYDPTPELNAIQQQQRERQQKISQANAAKAEVDARVADLRQQAQAKEQQARSLGQEAGRLRQQVANQTAVEGEQTLMKAREITRRADGLEVESAEFQARAEQIEPDILEIATRIEGFRHQLERLETAANEVQERARRSREEASQARAAAARVSQELDAALKKLDALRTGELAENYQAAITGYEAAAASARRAQNVNRVGANLAIGTAQQAIGDLQWSRSHGLGFYHQTLSALAETEPALPNAQQYRQMVQATATARQEALAAATEAFGAAYDAYQGAGAGERMQRVSNSLNEIVNTTSGGSRDLGAAMTPELDTLPAMDWPTGAVEPGYTPQETLASLVSGLMAFDAGIIELLHFDSAEQRAMAESIMSLLPAVKRFAEAMTAQFGAGAEAGLMELASQAPGFGDLSEFDPSEADITIDGDTALLDIGEGEPLKFRQVGGVWLIDLSEVLDHPDMQEVTQMVPKVRGMLDGLTADVEAGKFSSEQEAVSALMMRLMMMGGSGGG